MNQELVPANIEDINALIEKEEVGKYSSPAVVNDATSPSWLPYLKLIGGNKEEFPAFFQLIKGRQKVNLGEEIVILLASYRVKAFNFTKLEAHYNPESKEYQYIKENCDKKDSGLGFGPELLVWLPEHGEFASLFCYSKTQRNEAPNMIDSFPEKKTFRLKTTFINPPASKYKWWGYAAFPYDLDVALPPMETFMELRNKFNNHPDSEMLGSEEESGEEVGDEETRA